MTDDTNSSPILERIEQLKADPSLLETFMVHLSKTVKHDEATKKAVFLTALSAYTCNPQNLFLRGPSSIGKTYNIVQALKYFPKEDLWLLGGLSPTALVHDFGIFIDPSTDEEIDFEDKPKKADFKDKQGKINEEEYKRARESWKEKIARSYYLVELSNKIIVFLEAPHYETYQKLRPILSHDAERISYRFTDKTAKGGLTTKHVVLEGWPATIFASSDFKYVEDLATRGLTSTPKMEAVKYKEAVKLHGDVHAMPWSFNEDPELEALRGYINAVISRSNIMNRPRIVNPFARELAEMYPATLPRDMRDFDHFLALMDISALLHLYQRPFLMMNEYHHFLVTMKDFVDAFNIFVALEETTRTGIPQNVLDCFYKAVLPLWEETGNFGYSELVDKYNEVFEPKKSGKTLYDYVRLLQDIGYVDVQPDPSDKRKRLIRVIENPKNILDSSLRRFPASFSLESLKKWFEEAKNYSGKKEVYIVKNLNDRVHIDVEALYEQFSLIKTQNFSEYFLEPKKEETDLKTEKEAKNIPSEEKGRFLSFSIHEILSGPHILAFVISEANECPGCGQKRILNYTVSLFDGSTVRVCHECADKVEELMHT